MAARYFLLLGQFFGKEEANAGEAGTEIFSESVSSLHRTSS